MIVCFDIGGTAIKGAVAYSADDIRPFPRQPTPLHDFDAFVATLSAVIAEAEAQSGQRPDCIALSIAGVIDPDTFNATVANIPCIHGRPLQADLERALGLPVVIANDADCFVLAETGIGAARGHRVVFGIILGTGVGGGLVIDGKLINRRTRQARLRSECPVSNAAAARSAASMRSAVPEASRNCIANCMAKRARAKTFSPIGRRVKPGPPVHSTSIWTS
jgi:hypothetical protein